MGHLVEKYTDAYFLKKDEKGDTVAYGVEGIEAFERGELREHDREILRHVEFAGANVLEFGFGRGESIKYACENGATGYVGVDFSESACRIAGEFLRKFSIVGPRIVCSDALEFLRSHLANGGGESQKFDVVLMLDFVEHVPRNELAEILRLLQGCLRETSVVVVNTPDFLFDNDVIGEGLNEQGRDSSDDIEETRGMHCNRFTLESLRRFFLALGLAPVSRGHYFVPATTADQDLRAGVRSYAGTWADAQARGCRLKGDWPREDFETAYQVAEKPERHTFAAGNLAGLTIHVTRSYLEYFGGGNYDSFLGEFIARHDLAGKTVFDLGSFVGVNALQFARLVGPKGRVCAFEPNPINADRMRLNLSENPALEGRVRIFPFALSNVPGSVRFSLHRNVDAGVSSASYIQGAHTTLPQETLSDLGFTDVEVQTCTLDEFVQRSGLVPALLKIDIEGSEHLALLGGLATLREVGPPILMELHSTYCAVMVHETLHALGYTSELLHIEPDGRCYIGATRRSAVAGDGQQRPLESDAIQVSVLRHELERVRAGLEAQTRQGTDRSRQLARLEGEMAQLLAEAARLEGERAHHEAERARLEHARAALDAQLAACGSERDALAARVGALEAELRQQQSHAAEISEALERYRRFPLLRVARKLRRAFLVR